MSSRRRADPAQYGLSLGRPVTQQELEWYCFREGRTREQGGLGRAEHFRRAFRLTWPWVEWEKKDAGTVHHNHWIRRITDAVFGDRFVSRVGESTFRSVVMSGAGSCGKTFASACIAMGWWCVAPEKSSAVLTSTTIKMVGKRIWPTISRLHGSMVDAASGKRLSVGHMIPSQYVIKAKGTDIGSPYDEKAAVFAMAVAHGETQKAATNLRGLHSERMLLVVDEANGTPEAIFETIANLRKGSQDVTVIIIGNPVSKLDPHGRALEPKEGWGSVADDAYWWETKRVEQWDLDSGVALRFDGADSPNVAAGKTIFTGIYSWEDWARAQRKTENTLSYWSQDRGLHPPEGLIEAVLNEPALVAARVDEQLVFQFEGSLAAFLDPAFGGDAAMVKVGRVGRMADGRMGIQLTERIEIDIVVGNEEPDLQVARGFIQICKDRKIPPENAGLDATGTGRGVYAFIAYQWSGAVMRFEAAESPGDSPVMEEDDRPASEVYQNRITESWVAVGALVRTGQLKGLFNEDKSQFTTRKLETKRTFRGRQRLEDKDLYKRRYGQSPDDADATAGLADLARRRLGVGIGGVGGSKSSDAWRELVAKCQAVYAEGEGAEPEPDPIYG